jgi:hypothetical protein
VEDAFTFVGLRSRVVTKVSTASYFHIASIHKKPSPGRRPRESFATSPSGSVFRELEVFEQSIVPEEREVSERVRV